jgi:hypothetical protein
MLALLRKHVSGLMNTQNSSWQCPGILTDSYKTLHLITSQLPLARQCDKPDILNISSCKVCENSIRRSRKGVQLMTSMWHSQTLHARVYAEQLLLSCSNSAATSHVHCYGTPSLPWGVPNGISICCDLLNWDWGLQLSRGLRREQHTRTSSTRVW